MRREIVAPFRRNKQEQEEKDNNVVQFETVTGGKDNGSNWLLDMDNQRVFLTQIKYPANLDPRMPKPQKNVIRPLWKKVDTTEHGSVLLMDGYKLWNHGVREYHYVDPDIFVEQFKFVEDMTLLLPEGDQNGQDDQDPVAGQGTDPDPAG
jgi:hypothetical protein